MNRLYNLDYLRGLAAVMIMIYHYRSWIFGTFDASTIMGRIGLYGVSIFYVLSGLTLYYVYYEKMKPSLHDVIAFFKKRVFRIFPLLWIVTFVAIWLSEKDPDLFHLFLNLSGLFGFVKWDTYFSPGVWSIGNELVFYVFFPLFVLFSKSNKVLMVALSALIFSVCIYFAFVKIIPEQTWSAHWDDYVNPLNQVFLFLGGFLTGLAFSRIQISNALVIALFLVGSTLFIFTPANGETIVLVTGVNRLIFTLSCFLICLSFYKLTLKFPAFVHKPLTLLGEASYSVYLLHPIVLDLVGRFSKHVMPLTDLARMLISVSLTLLLSFFIYEYFEKYFMKLGRRKENVVT